MSNRPTSITERHVLTVRDWRRPRRLRRGGARGGRHGAERRWFHMGRAAPGACRWGGGRDRYIHAALRGHPRRDATCAAAAASRRPGTPQRRRDLGGLGGQRSGTVAGRDGRGCRHRRAGDGRLAGRGAAPRATRTAPSDRVGRLRHRARRGVGVRRGARRPRRHRLAAGRRGVGIAAPGARVAEPLRRGVADDLRDARLPRTDGAGRPDSGVAGDGRGHRRARRRTAGDGARIRCRREGGRDRRGGWSPRPERRGSLPTWPTPGCGEGRTRASTTGDAWRCGTLVSGRRGSGWRWSPCWWRSALAAALAGWELGTLAVPMVAAGCSRSSSARGPTSCRR